MSIKSLNSKTQFNVEKKSSLMKKVKTATIKGSKTYLSITNKCRFQNLWLLDYPPEVWSNKRCPEELRLRINFQNTKNHFATKLQEPMY